MKKREREILVDALQQIERRVRKAWLAAHPDRTLADYLAGSKNTKRGEVWLWWRALSDSELAALEAKL
jgi:hypothetical protein